MSSYDHDRAIMLDASLVTAEAKVGRLELQVARIEASGGDGILLYHEHETALATIAAERDVELARVAAGPTGRFALMFGAGFIAGAGAVLAGGILL